MTAPTIIVYRDTLLPHSETFVRAQAESLCRFRPVYVGLRRIPGLNLPTSRTTILCGGGVAGTADRILFKLWGPHRFHCKQVAALSPVLIHAHFAPDASEVRPLAHRLKLPLITSLHGYDVTAVEETLPRRYVRRKDRLTREGARFLCVSEFVRREALARGFPADRTIVHYTGIDTTFFSPRPDVERRPEVLFVGRLWLNKGCEYLIRAMASAQSEIPGVKLVIIGDGPLRDTLTQQAAQTLANWEFLGVQSPDVVRERMNSAAVFCVPSVSITSGEAEGFGMAFAEAQAMGLPVVSFSVGGIPEAVVHGSTGFLARERDVDGIASRLIELLRNQKLWQQFSHAARTHVTSRFDVHRQSTLLEHIYDEVLSEPIRQKL